MTSNYREAVYEGLIGKIAGLTGIKQTVLEENGVRFTLQHPTAVNATKRQLQKLELLKRFINEYNEAVFLEEVTTIGSSTAAGEYFSKRLANVGDRERFEIAFLNCKNEIIKTVTMFTGTLEEAPIYAREIVKAAIRYDANKVILAHNHPGGTCHASMADREATKRIKAALELVNVKIIDHIIVAGDKYVSFAEKGWME